MVDQQKVVYGLSNGAIFSDLERTVPPLSRSHRYLMPKICRNRTIYRHSFNGITNTHALLNSVISNDLE